MSSNLAAVLPLKAAHSPRGRQLILVDIENVVGGAVLTPAAARWARTQIESVLSVRADDHVVIGMSHVGLFDSALAWPGKKYVVNSGPNGADLALLAEMESVRVERYDEVVLVSGDGIFTEAVSALIDRGARVTVLTHRAHCSKRLRLAAHETVDLQPGHNISSDNGAAR
ncbi:hypothetical protein BJ980_002285 [Nocardioides daedukensis]|uniref:NYN domain-containing protein n=1 Tax=Nocardioides daedukensis TaxID=634462 RepID=A0A7Y9RZ74_9ACTN|nr:NYN domain-containing protein [Nocardioides daedukensis]NYG59362.1 hypothetical protein [Nocardioides daedukensis]